MSDTVPPRRDLQLLKVLLDRAIARERRHLEIIKAHPESEWKMILMAQSRQNMESYQGMLARCQTNQ